MQNHEALNRGRIPSALRFISETKSRRLSDHRQCNGTKAGNDYTYALAKTIPGLPANVYLNPISLGLATEGSNASNQLGVGTLTVQVNNVRQFKSGLSPRFGGLHSFKFGYEYLVAE